MTAELVRGQNHPLPGTRLEIRVSAGNPVVAGATLNDEQGRMRGRRVDRAPRRAAAARARGLPAGRGATTGSPSTWTRCPRRCTGSTCCSRCPTGVGGPGQLRRRRRPLRRRHRARRRRDRQLHDHRPRRRVRRRRPGAVPPAGRLEGPRRRPGVRGRARRDARRPGPAPRPRELAATINEAVAAGMARSVAPPRRVRRGPHPPRTRPRAAPQGVAGPAPGGGDRAAGRAPRAGTGRAGPRQPSASAPPAPRRPAPRLTPSPPDRRPATAAQLPAPRRRRRGAAAPAAGARPARPGRPAARRRRRHRLDHGRAALQPGLGHVRGPGPHGRRLPQRRRLRRVPHGAGARQGPLRPAHPRRPRRPTPPASEARAKHAAARRPGPRRARPRPGPAQRRGRGRRARAAARLRPLGQPGLAGVPGARWRSRWPCAWATSSLPESAGLRIPMLVRLPLERGLWIDSGRSRLRGGVARGLRRAAPARRWTRRWRIAARLLAVYPAGEFTRPRHRPGRLGRGRARAAAWRPGCCRSRPPPAPRVSRRCWRRLTQRVDLVQMAVRSGAADSLPPDLDTAEQLLIVHDFPHGFDDRAVTQLRYLADEGPAVGVHLLMVADREDAARLRTAARPAVALAAAHHARAGRPSRRPVGGARLDVRAAARAARQPGAPQVLQRRSRAAPGLGRTTR